MLALLLAGSSLATALVWREQARTRTALAAESLLHTEAVECERVIRRHLYAAEMNLAHQAWDLGNVAYALDILERQRPAAGKEDLRGFEWGYLCSSAAAAGSKVWPCTGDPSADSPTLPTAALLASGAADGTIALSALGEPGPRHFLHAHRGPVTALRFACDGKLLASASSGEDHSVAVWDPATGRERCAGRPRRSRSETSHWRRMAARS